MQMNQLFVSYSKYTSQNNQTSSHHNLKLNLTSVVTIFVTNESKNSRDNLKNH